MKKVSTFLVILTFIFASLIILSGCKNSGNHKSEGVHWTYEGETAPETWATLSEDYSDCAGKSQSPVDITGTVKDSTLKPLYVDYLPSTKLDIFNNGHSVQINYNAGTFVIEGQEYHLLQFHFHSPSEFTYNGEHFPLEVHLVHADANGNLAVIGVMVEVGTENQFFAKFWDKLPDEEGELETFDINFDINNLLPPDKGFYHLIGSLTTPPCTEGVKWYLLKTPVEATKEQIEKIALCMPENNNRPVQALNGRVIKEF
jgi:carbonic anhydrase